MSTQLNYLNVNMPVENKKSFMQATLGTSQNTNLAVGDHAKFDRIINVRGNSITLDRTTPYTSVAGVASLGRFTLVGGRSYSIRCSISAFFSADTFFKMRWFDVTTATRIPISIVAIIRELFGSSILIFPSYTIEAIITPTNNMLIELGINNISSGTITELRAPGFTVFGANDFSGINVIIKEL